MKSLRSFTFIFLAAISTVVLLTVSFPLLFVSSAAAAHPISVTEANAFVTQNKLTIRLTIFAEDLYMFQELEPDEKDMLSRDKLQKGMEKHKQFLLDRVIVRNAGGERLSGRITDVKPFEMPEQGVAVSDLMMYSITYELEYTFDKAPEFLTIAQEIADANFLFPSEMKLWLKQAGSGIAFTAVLRPGKPETVRFDWSGVQLAEDASDEDWEKWINEQRQQTLGITSYSSIYSFIYITDHEVRHEILVPLVSLASLFEIKREDPAFLTVEEQDAARPAIEDYFRDCCRVEIDGVTVAPVFDRVDFYGLDLRDFAQRTKRGRVSMANGRVGLIMSYSAFGRPKQVKVTWEKFNSTIRKIESVVFAYDDTLKTTFSRFREDNTFTWTNENWTKLPKVRAVQSSLPPPPKMRLPLGTIVGAVATLLVLGVLTWRAVSLKVRTPIAAVMAVGCVALWQVGTVEIEKPFAKPPPLPSEQAESVFQRLHANIYRAFSYRQEDEIYDALAKSIDGRLLRQVYLQIRKGLEMQEQGGAVSRVKEVKYIEGKQGEPQSQSVRTATGPAFNYHCKWKVRGTVEHWGHVHERSNQYDALFTVEVRDDAWKITDIEVLDEERLPLKTRVRKF